MPVKKALLFSLIFFSQLQLLHAQICVDDYFAINYTTASVQSPVVTISTPGNEILMAGNAARYNSLLQGGWLTKFSAQGTVLWSRLYYTGQYNFINFTNIVPVDQDNYLITGNIGDVDTASWPLVHLSEFGLLLKVDKYGNIIWSKILANIIRPFASSDVNSVAPMKNGDLILSLSYFTTQQYMVVMRIDGNGNTIWTSLLSSPSRNTGFGSMKLKILSSGNIVFANSLTEIDDYYAFQKQGYYFACLNGATGERVWNRFFLSADTLSSRQGAFGEIVNIAELPNHDLSFITSYADIPVGSYFRKTDKVLNFITDSFGVFKKLVSYTSSISPLYASSAMEFGNANRIILMDDGDIPLMMRIDAQGNVVWQKGYALIGRGQATKSVLSTNYGFYFFSYTNNGGSKEPKLVKTDTLGNAPCVESPFSVSAKDVTSSYFMQVINITLEKASGSWGNLFAPGVYNYSIQGHDACRIACCQDVTDTADEIRLCDKNEYTLPNNDVIKNSGHYALTYKTSKGCDSIVFYNIVFNFTPSISLGADTCFGEKDSLILKAKPGYDAYVWNGINSNTYNYTVRQPGIYTLRASNECGISADTVQIFKECEFEIYMPNAFSPNGDGLNDLFRVPKQNYNRLVSFTIFNRWGQKVFATQNISEGWNGMKGAYQASVGTYIYMIEMRSLDGKKTFTQKGYVTLIR